MEKFISSKGQILVPIDLKIKQLNGVRQSDMPEISNLRDDDGWMPWQLEATSNVGNFQIFLCDCIKLNNINC